MHVRKFSGSPIDLEKNILITRHNGIKLIRLPKVTDMKGGVLKRHLERKISNIITGFHCEAY